MSTPSLSIEAKKKTFALKWKKFFFFLFKWKIKRSWTHMLKEWKEAEGNDENLTNELQHFRTFFKAKLVMKNEIYGRKSCISLPSSKKKISYIFFFKTIKITFNYPTLHRVPKKRTKKKRWFKWRNEINVSWSSTFPLLIKND